LGIALLPETHRTKSKTRIKIGLNYVSCSPYRVPIARLAAAQANLKDGGSNRDR